jgi:hypothetical protein
MNILLIAIGIAAVSYIIYEIVLYSLALLLVIKEMHE